MLKFQQKLLERKKMGSERSLSLFNGFSDFFSNDYLGLGAATEFQNVNPSGGGGSRLISGNYPSYKMIIPEKSNRKMR